MGKESRTIGFSKATITKEETGEYIITEYSKEETKVYSLSDKLDELLEIDNLTITIKKDNEIPTIE